MPMSFRKGVDPVPLRYRTPSPPRDAFEPLSPTDVKDASATLEKLNLQWAGNGEIRNRLKRRYPQLSEKSDGPKKQRHVSEGAMAAFASTAPATKSTNRCKLNLSTGVYLDKEYGERSSKRAKSEKLASPDRSRISKSAIARPTTSYEQSPENMRLEAELLLNFAHTNFAQAAAHLAPSPSVDPWDDTIHPWTHSEKTDNTVPGITVNRKMDVRWMHPNTVVRENGEVLGKAELQIPLGADLMVVKDHGEEAHSDQPAAKDPSDTCDFVHPLQETNKSSTLRYFTSQRDEVPVISAQDDIDSMPGSSSLGQGAVVGHEEIPESIQKNESESPDGPEVAVCFNFNDAFTKEQSGMLQSPICDILSAENTSQCQISNTRVLKDDTRIEGKSTMECSLHEMRQLPQEDSKTESQTIHGALDNDQLNTGEILELPAQDSAPPAAKTDEDWINVSDARSPDVDSDSTVATAVCAACKLIRNSKGFENENDSTSWICCDACKSWFHFACAGFKNEREVRGVDKFKCRKCKPTHGATTYVRKSSRAHSAIDYAGLHQGVIKTSDERPEHHYIKPIKEGTITFQPETFARMRPELVTAEYFEKGIGMREPIVIPACFDTPSKRFTAPSIGKGIRAEDVDLRVSSEGDGGSEDWFSGGAEYEMVPDHGQNALDMVVPQGLTVRQVAELYGPEEKVEVIDVKSQNGENKKWNMKRWADYYENPNNKVVRNVISLEVSQSKLGRLIRRPQVVRDLDLQDSVWPEDLLAKGEYPRVQFYCLMSVADCFTDFHIDFGGSSVFYHILKGKKTFLFIPPKEKHLKKYEEWCMSPAQNWTFLGDQTKECYRVDLSEGDTMLIPSGWIHAVWTPEDSLVIGGNFLTRMNFGMQLRVAQVEKATGVARKFRYPHFQKLHWYTALRYLEDDPLPSSVRDLLHTGGSFYRQIPAHYDFDAWGENSRAGLENYHARYYSQPELGGLPDLIRYLLRTALIDLGSISDGISADTRNAVKKSIPRGHGDPLDNLKTFAAWCAWKRGNEPIPHWAYPDAVPESLAPDRLSAAAMKKLDREAALSAPRRQSARMQCQQELSKRASSDSQAPSPSFNISSKPSALGPTDFLVSGSPKKSKNAPGTGYGSHRKTACESCRKRRRACKHKDEVTASMSASATSVTGAQRTGFQTDRPNLLASPSLKIDMGLNKSDSEAFDEVSITRKDQGLIVNPEQLLSSLPTSQRPDQNYDSISINCSTASQATPPSLLTLDQTPSEHATINLEPIYGNLLPTRPRHKACGECRKSKRRCIHDAFGNEDPVKVRETAIPRPHARKSNVQSKDGSIKTTCFSRQRGPCRTDTYQSSSAVNTSTVENSVRRLAPVATMVATLPSSQSNTHDNKGVLDATIQKDIAERASLLLDPALFSNNVKDSACPGRPSHSMISTSPSGVADDHRPITTTPNLDPMDQHTPSIFRTALDAKFRMDSRESLEQPASSLVSPPASSHDGGGDSPPGVRFQRALSRSCSEQSSTQLRQLQHQYTPESGPIRRPSNSSCDDIPPKQAGPSHEAVPDFGLKPRAEPRAEYVADEESLKLIKELQAQELGLRRRGKV